MKIHLVEIFVLMLFLLGCANTSVPTSLSVPDTAQASVVATSTVFPIVPTFTPSSAVTQYPSTPTFIPANLPDDLVVSYIVENSLWVWQQNDSQMLMQQKNMSEPVFSDDGQWILFRQRHISLDGITSTFDELWVVRTDGSEIERLVGSDDLMALTGKKVLMDYFSWLPGHHEILFNTEEIIDGPPGSWSLFDLYSVDLTGTITQLLKPSDAGRFVSSPDGVHVALATGSSIKVFDLESGKQRTLLEFEPVLVPMDGGPPTPKVVWDPDGQFVVTSILPKNLYYPEKYAGEPAQVWRLYVNGQIELITELQPFIPNTRIVFSPNLQYFFYLKNSCFDGMGMLYVHNVMSAEEYPLSCVWNVPQWAPDNNHFIYEVDWLWQLGGVSDKTNQPLDILNIPTDPNVQVSPQLTWINDEYFLLLLRSSDACVLNIATLQGIVTEIARTSPDVCLRRVDFSLN